MVVRLVLLGLLASFGSAHAQFNGSNWGFNSPQGIAYVGPADLPGLSSPTAFYGLRGISAAYAAPGTGKAVNVRRASDNTTQDIVILSNGNLDVATAASFAGTAATCSGTISGTTAALTGCSATPAANQPVSGVGVTQPAYVVSCGAFVAGAGSCTLNAAESVAVAETLTFQVALFVTTWYDQSGNSGHNGTQGTAAAQAEILLSCVNSQPCLFSYVSATFSNYNVAIGPIGQPVSTSMVALRIVNKNNNDQIVNAGLVFGFGGSNALEQFAGTLVSVSGVNDNIWHSASFVFNGASSNIYIDGTTTNTPTIGTYGIGSSGNLFNPSNGVDGYTSEIIFWPLALNSTQQASLRTNQKSYWGTP